MPCYVRPMTKEDIPQVTEIDREAFPTQWPPPNYHNEMRNQMAFFSVVCEGEKPQTPDGKNAATRKEDWLTRISRLFGSGVSGRRTTTPSKDCIIGFVGSWIMADEAHITSIAVRETHRRQGIGEMLMVEAIELALKMKADILTLEVRVSNTGAQSLYTKYGFTQVGLRKAYYTDNREDALIMSTDKIKTPAFQSRYQELKQSLARRQSAGKTAAG